MNVELATGAKRDLLSIERYWFDRDPEQYVALASALEIALTFLSETPYAGSRVERSTARKWRVGRTPFLLFYRIRRDVLLVGRIRHERENWRKRN